MKPFIVKVLTKDVGEEGTVPMHPEFSFVKMLQADIWQVKDKNEKMFQVKKIAKGTFTVYEIEEIA